MNHKNQITAVVIVVLVLMLVLAGGAYWYYLTSAPSPQGNTASSTAPGGFQPFGRTDQTGSTGGTGTSGTGSNAQGATSTASGPLPILRLLSTTPVGGYGASTTPATTVVRWVDRGRGNTYQASYDTSAITLLSNTVVPKIFASIWNKNATAFIGSMFSSDNSSWSAVYTQLTAQSASSVSSAASSSSDQTTVAPFALRGKKLPDNIITYAVSPKKDKLFMLVNEGGIGAGYVSSIDGSGVTKIFTTPLTQVHAEWPTDATIAITTNASASYSGYLYFVSPTSGTWTKELGPIVGLNGVVSHDGKYILYSSVTSDGSLTTSIYTVSKGTTVDAGIATLADKCAWGNYYTDVAYCAVPYQLPTGTYPDDWYRGTLSTIDKVWQIDATTGNTGLILSLIDQADRQIDAFSLGTDPKDNYLFFMNKNDLSLWSLDLTQAHQ